MLLSSSPWNRSEDYLDQYKLLVRRFSIMLELRSSRADSRFSFRSEGTSKIVSKTNALILVLS